MKVLSQGRAFDFDKVVSLYFRESVIGNGYPIEIKIAGSGAFDSPVEIARVSSASRAYLLVSTITEHWAAQTPLFDVDAWLAENSAASISV